MKFRLKLKKIQLKLLWGTQSWKWH